MEVSGQFYASAVLLPEKEPTVTIVQVAWWVFWIRGISIAATGIRTSERTGSNLVAIPSYPGHL